MSEIPTSGASPKSTSSSRRSSFSRSGHRRGLSGITPRELKYIDNVIPLDRRQKWKKYSAKPIESTENFESEFVRNVETSLGRSLYNCDTLAAYQATARSLRDTLIIRWNRTQQLQTLDDPKRVYYLSLEYLMGRALDNAALNMGLQTDVKVGLDDFGFRFEDIVNKEPDAGLGNGGLGRLAACFVDSLCTLDYPAWAYGIRYRYGIFRQKLVNGAQVEFPDTWLDFGNPWEIPRPELSFDIMFYGRVEENADGSKNWIGGDLVEAKAFDFLVPGFSTKNVNTLRLWDAEPSSQFDFAKFNEGDYTDAVAEQVDASTISAVLYPNDNFYSGKELRLKQQYFWVAASLADITRRFKKTGKPWSQFADSCAIQLNDTHPTLAVVELLRILVDIEKLDWHEAWAITTSTFAYTNHTVMPEALEKWGIDIMGNLLPRHLEIVYNINYFFLKDVAAKFPGDDALLSRVSLIEESSPKQVRMAYLAVIATHKVNGVAELHSDLIKTTIFKDFVKILGENHFTNITNGITPRRWLLESNPRLSALIASKTGGYGFIKDLDQLQHIKKYVDDPEFRKQWITIKEANKARLVELIQSQQPDVKIDPSALFDVQVKRIHEYKRQQLNLFGIVYRYLYLKSLSPEQRKHIAPRVSIFGGKSAPGYYAAKLIIKLINAVGKTIAEDPDVSDYLKVIYIEEYNVSKAEVIVSASDISEHISTAGTEASGTSNMKFVLNGGLIIGTVDGANIEIGREIGEENIYYFGHLSEAVDEVRNENSSGVVLSEKLQKVFETIQSGVFGNPEEYSSLLDATAKHGDFYLVNADFDSYIETQSKIDEDFKNKDRWITKCINSVASMGFFSSDRAIREYAENIWDVTPCPVEAGDPLSPVVNQTGFDNAPVSAAHGKVAARNSPPTTKEVSSDKETGFTDKSKQVAGEVATGAAAAAAATGAAVAGAVSYLTGKDETTTGTSTSGNDSTPSYDHQFTSAPIGGDIPTTSFSSPQSGTDKTTYTHAGTQVLPSAASNTAAGQAAAKAFGGSKRESSYDPVSSTGDEGPVTGSYGSYAAKPTTHESEPASYGSAGATGASLSSTTGAVPPPSSGAVASTETGTTGYSDKDVDSSVGGFAGTGEKSYNPYGKESDPPVPVSGALPSEITDSSAVGGYEGEGKHSYDPAGQTNEPSVPTTRNSGMFTEISSNSSIETSSTESEVVPKSDIHRNLADPSSLSNASISTAKPSTHGTDARQGGIAGNASDAAESFKTPTADQSFSGPSTQEIPESDSSTWSDKATGLAAGAGAAATGAAAALLGKASGGKDTSAAQPSTSESTGQPRSLVDQATGLAAGAGAAITGAAQNVLPQGSSTDTAPTTTGNLPSTTENKSTSSSTTGSTGLVDQATGLAAGAGAAVTGAIQSVLPQGSTDSAHATTGSLASTTDNKSASTSTTGDASLTDKATGIAAAAGASAAYTINSALGSISGTDAGTTTSSKSVDTPSAVLGSSSTASAGTSAGTTTSSKSVDTPSVTLGSSNTSPSRVPQASYGNSKAPETRATASAHKASPSAEYKTLDPAVDNDKYTTELSSPSKGTTSSAPIVTDGIAHGTAPTTSTGTKTGAKSDVASSAAPSSSGATGAQLSKADPKVESASVASLDSRTAPIPDSGATVSGAGGDRFTRTMETSDRGVGYDDNRRHSRESYGTSTGETDFEDALDDYGSPEPQHASKYRTVEGDASSISSQSTIGKKHSKPAAPTADISAGTIGLASAGSAADSTATQDTRPPTTATSAGSATTSTKQSSAPPKPITAHSNDPDLIPTDALKSQKDVTGGDNTALKGPEIDREKVEETHDVVIAAAKTDGETQGITTKNGAKETVNETIPGKGDKHAQGEKEGGELNPPDKKKACFCC